MHNYSVIADCAYKHQPLTALGFNWQHSPLDVSGEDSISIVAVHGLLYSMVFSHL